MKQSDMLIDNGQARDINQSIQLGPVPEKSILKQTELECWFCIMFGIMFGIMFTSLQHAHSTSTCKTQTLCCML